MYGDSGAALLARPHSTVRRGVSSRLTSIALDSEDRRVLSGLAKDLAAEAAGDTNALGRLAAAGTGSLSPRLADVCAEAATPVSSHSAWLLTDLPIRAAALGRTPTSWRERTPLPTVEDCQLVLLGQALGTVFAWEDQQGGATVHTIVPTPGDETSLLSSSSATELSLHTEDAYFSERADRLLLLALRNPRPVATFVS